MKKCLLIPTVIFPYMICFCFGYSYVAQSFSNTTVKVLAIVSLVCLVLSFVSNLAYIFITKKETSEKILKAALIIKIIHIPTYILIFALGVMMAVMFFMTFPFIILLVIIDTITLWLSGMISVYALAKTLKERNDLSKVPLIIAIVCQMVFCADIVSVFVIRLITNKQNKLSV